MRPSWPAPHLLPRSGAPLHRHLTSLSETPPSPLPRCALRRRLPLPRQLRLPGEAHRHKCQLLLSVEDAAAVRSTPRAWARAAHAPCRLSSCAAMAAAASPRAHSSCVRSACASSASSPASARAASASCSALCCPVGRAELGGGTKGSTQALHKLGNLQSSRKRTPQIRLRPRSLCGTAFCCNHAATLRLPKLPAEVELQAGPS